MSDSTLEYLPPNFIYKIESEEEGSSIIRIKELIDENSALNWLKKYSDTSWTTWRKARTFPHPGKRNVFKVDLRCAHFTDRRTRGERSSKHTGCEAKLQIVIKRKMEIKERASQEVNGEKSDSESNGNELLDEDFPGVVTFRKNHNHSLTAPVSLKHRDMDPMVKEQLLNLFHIGHGPSSALISYKIDLMIDLKDNYYEVAADGKYVPSLSIVSKLFQREFGIETCKQDIADIFRILQALLEEYNQNSMGKAILHHKDGHYFVVICTPTMLQVHKNIQRCSELVMVDAFTSSGVCRHRIYRLFTPCVSGGLPLGIIITDKEKDSVLFDALECFKKMLKENAFFGQGVPRVFVTSNNLIEINAFQKAFPDSMKLLCQFHVLRSVWAWLCNLKHSVSQNHRQELYYLFKKVVYSKCETDCLKNYLNLRQSAQSKKYSHLIAYLDSLWIKKTSWAAFHRKNISVEGNDTTNYAEVVFRILNECIFDKVTAFNLTQIVHFIISGYEAYLRQRFIYFCNNQNHNFLLKNMMPVCEENEYYLVEHDTSLNIFNVESELGNIYTVDFNRMFCTCQYGVTKELCKHASAVILSLENIISTFVYCDAQTKKMLLSIAEGEDSLSNGFSSIQKSSDNLVTILPLLGKSSYTNSDSYGQLVKVMCTNDIENPNINHDLSLGQEDNSDIDGDLSLCQEENSDLNDDLSLYQEENSDLNDDLSLCQEENSDLNDDLSLCQEENSDLNDDLRLWEDSNSATNDDFKLCEEEFTEFDNIVSRVRNGLTENPKTFVPAVKKMLKNAKKFVSSEANLIRALENFGVPQYEIAETELPIPKKIRLR